MTLPAQATLSPELSVRRGRQALEFYKAAFGAVEIYRVGGTEENEVSDESPPNSRPRIVLEPSLAESFPIYRMNRA